jgi:hypothetical protein
MAGAACAALEVIALRSTRSPDLAKYPPIWTVTRTGELKMTRTQNWSFCCAG